jgi:hypothetical protein
MNNADFVTTSAYVQSSDNNKIIYPFGPPIFQTIIPDDFCRELLSVALTLNKKDHDCNFDLAGNLKYGRSYRYELEFMKKVEPALLDYARAFFDMLDKQHNTKQMHNTTYDTLYLDSLWVNFNQKHDFNPPHSHNGDISFVIYLDVPQEIFEVQADSNCPEAGQIVFEYGDKICDFMYDNFKVKPFNSLMLLFPAKLRHYVAPYWVDKQRISVAGNFRLK